MYKLVLALIVSLSFPTFSNNAGKENNSPIIQNNQESKESSFIQIDAKKSKKFEIYTVDGKFVTDGILDFNSRVDVSNLEKGSYLVVVGKKAFQFSVN
jgi:hypothetical protein